MTPTQTAKRNDSPFRLVMSRLEKDSRGKPRCPVSENHKNGDKNSSLKVTDTTNSVLMFCHAGCTFDDIVDALDLEMQDLFVDDPVDRPISQAPACKGTPPCAQSASCQHCRQVPVFVPPVMPIMPPREYFDRSDLGQADVAYPYIDADGQVWRWNVRYPGKQFRQRRADGAWTTDGCPPLLFALPSLLKADHNQRVYKTEGEKDADTLIGAGYLATTTGASSTPWVKEHTDQVAGFLEVAIMADRDMPGWKCAMQTREAIMEHDPRIDVRVMLPVPGYNDVTDHIEAGYTVEQLQEWDPNLDSDSWDEIESAGLFWYSHPEVTAIRKFAHSRQASPLGVLMHVVLRVLASTPPNVVLPPVIGGHASLNTFLGFVGESGMGKDMSEDVGREAANIVSGTSFIEKDPRSGQAILGCFVRKHKDFPTGELYNTSALVSITEIGKFNAVGSQSSSTLWPELRHAWMGKRISADYADSQNNLMLPTDNYRLCLSAGIQPALAGPLFKDTDAGTPQRFIWVNVVDRSIPHHHLTKDMPSVPITWSLPFALSGRYGDNRTVMSVCDLAAGEIRDNHTRVRRGDPDARRGHHYLCREKLAAGLALLFGSYDVDETVWRMSGHIMASSDRTMAEVRSALASKKTSEVTSRAHDQITMDRVIATEKEQREYDITERVVRRLQKVVGDPQTEAKLIKSSLTTARGDREFWPAVMTRLRADERVVVDPATGLIHLA